MLSTGLYFYPHQVCSPGLHISLRIFDRLYNLLAIACDELNCLVAEVNAGEGTSFSQYQEAYLWRSEILRKIEYYEGVITTGNQMTTHVLLHMPNIDPDHPVVQQCRETMADYIVQVKRLVCNYYVN